MVLCVSPCGRTLKGMVRGRPNTAQQGIAHCHPREAWVCFLSYNFLLCLGKDTPRAP